MEGIHVEQRTVGRLSVWLIAGAAGSAVGCADNTGDPKFAAQTFDEYTEPLTNAVVGTPSGTTTIGPNGETTFVPAEVAAVAAAPAPSTGTGGITGADGGVAGSFGTGGSPGMGGGFGTGGMVGVDGGSPDSGGFGFWHLDDCSPTSHFLADSSGFGANAQQALKADCVPGISNQGVQIRSAKDVIQVPDEPQFTVSDRVAVAAWVHPNTVSGTQPIVLKRLNNQTSF